MNDDRGAAYFLTSRRRRHLSQGSGWCRRRGRMFMVMSVLSRYFRFPVNLQLVSEKRNKKREGREMTKEIGHACELNE
jgi:hypothetical protein